MHLRFLGWVDMKIGGGSGGPAYRCVVVEVSSDWSKIDKKAMPILGRFALQNVAAGQGPPRPTADSNSILTLTIGALQYLT